MNCDNGWIAAERKKNRRGKPVGKKVSDSTEHGAHVLFTELVSCERVGAVFYTKARSNHYERSGAMTVEYVRELVRQLVEKLREYDTETGARQPLVDGITLKRDGDAIAFKLTLAGALFGEGAVTLDVGRKAKAWLDDQFGPGNVVKFRKSAH